MLAITRAGYYQSHDRIQATNGMLAITSQEFSTCSNTWGDEEFVKRVAIPHLADLEQSGQVRNE
jgi:hypothetical protein